MVVLSIFAAISTFSAGAEWSTNPIQNNPVCQEGEDQFDLVMIDDGAGGSIIAWTDVLDYMVSDTWPRGARKFSGDLGSRWSGDE